MLVDGMYSHHGLLELQRSLEEAEEEKVASSDLLSATQHQRPQQQPLTAPSPLTAAEERRSYTGTQCRALCYLFAFVLL